MLPQLQKALFYTFGALTLASLGGAGYSYYCASKAPASTKQIAKKPSGLFSPLANESSEMDLTLNPTNDNALETNIPGQLHILFLGADKRSPSQSSYRTDSIMLVSILKDEKRALLTSIPRDLWLGGTKINAHFCNEGFDPFKERISKVLGIEPDYYISTGFEGFVWSLDQLGKIEPNIKRSFTDTNYPADRPNAPHPPNFQAGVQTLTPEEALMYCRSRKGTNGEGSDFQRMRRQQNLMVSLPGTFKNSNLFKLTAEALYNLFIGRIQTNMGVGDASRLLPIVKDWENYEIENLVLDTNNYLVHPPMSEYGGAYVLTPRTGSFDEIKEIVQAKLNGTFTEPAQPSSCSTCGN